LAWDGRRGSADADLGLVDMMIKAFLLDGLSPAPATRNSLRLYVLMINK
jgi:hypothetical protein